MLVPAAGLMPLSSLTSLVPGGLHRGVWQGRPRGREHQGERGVEEGREGRRGEGQWERTSELGFPPGSVLVVWVVK